MNTPKKTRKTNLTRIRLNTLKNILQHPVGIVERIPIIPMTINMAPTTIEAILIESKTLGANEKIFWFGGIQTITIAAIPAIAIRLLVMITMTLEHFPLQQHIKIIINLNNKIVFLID